MFVVSSNSASFLFPSISVHTDVKSLSSCFPFFIRSFPLEREEVQTLRCAISSRTRAVDGISLNLILGVPHTQGRHVPSTDITEQGIVASCGLQSLVDSRLLLLGKKVRGAGEKV